MILSSIQNGDLSAMAMKRISVVLLILMGLALGGAQVAAADKGTRPLRIVQAQRLPTLDPHFHATFVGHSVLGNIFDKLVGFDVEGEVVPMLASRWEKTAATIWRFELRRGVTFHDGRPLTTSDVVASLNRARSHPSSQVANYLVSVESVVALDEQRIEVRTRKLDQTLLNKLALIAIVPAGSKEEITRPIGTGPYRFESLVADDRLRLTVFDDYWRGAAVEPRVEFLFRPESLERGILLLNGDADLVVRLSPEDVEKIEDYRSDLWVESRLSLMIRFLMLNLEKPPLDDPRIREAIDLAVDRVAIAEQVLKGNAHPAGQLVGPQTPGYDARLVPTERNLHKARALLAEAGLSAPKLTFDFGTSSRSVGEAVAAQLAEAGFEITTRVRDWPDFIASLQRGEPSLALLGWSNSANDAGILYDAVIHTRDKKRGFGRANFLRLSNPELDAEIEACSGLAGVPERLEALEKLASSVARERYLLPMLWPLDLYGIRRDLQFAPRRDAHVYAYEIRRTGNPNDER